MSQPFRTLPACVLVVAGLAHPAIAADVPLKTTRIAAGLNNPTFLTHAGDSRLFVLERTTGAVRILHPNGQVTQFLNVASKLDIKHTEQGLLSLAFHPDYANNGFFYVAYTGSGGDNVIARYKVQAVNPNMADASSGVEILRMPKPFAHHNAGMLKFGPDGYLYVGVGDGGGGYDPFNNAQDLSSLLGKILRLDVDSAFPYAIPPTNPFAAAPGAKGEVWHYGIRNPWRFWVDTNGDMYIGDVGQEQREELDFAPGGVGGLNFGWRCFEGTLCLGQQLCPPCNNPMSTPPFLSYDHTAGCAVMGGVVYRGCAIPGLQGTYFYADWCTAKITSLRYDGAAVTELKDRTAELHPGAGMVISRPSSFGVGADGEMYIVDYMDGEVYRIEPDLPLGPDCNGNGAQDGCEIVAGTAFDANGNGAIDSCENLLTVESLQLGTKAKFQFVGANPQEFAFFVFSLAGQGPGACITPNVCLDLLNPIFLLAAVPADLQGKAYLEVFVAPSLPLVPIAFQAVLYRGAGGKDSVLSNAVAAQIQP